MNNSTKKVMQGAFVLSFASIIAKILSASYRIPLENLVGNTGFYVYQQVYPIYGLGMTFALNGFPIFISKLIAESDSEREQFRRIQASFIILTIISFGSFIVTFFGAHLIARGMGDPQLTSQIKVVSTMFWFMPLLAAGRGYYQGNYDVLPTAKSQVAEQIVRVSIIVGFAVWATQQHLSVYQTGTLIMTSSTVAAAVASLFFLRFGYQVIKNWREQIDWQFFNDLTKRFIIEGGLICLIAAMIIILQLVDSFTIKNSLVVAGVPDELAKALKGVYDRAQPLVQLGVVIATSFATSLLPALTESLQQQNMRGFYRASTSLIRVSMVISVAASAGMIVLMPEINQLLFGNQEGNMAIAIYNISIIFSALIFVYNSVLQSLDRVRITFFAIIAGVVVKMIFNSGAVRHFGISGASIVTVLSLAVIWLVMAIAVPTKIQSKVYFDNNFLLKLTLGILGMMVLTFISVKITGRVFNLPERKIAGVKALVGVIVGGWSFIVYVFRVRLFTLREWLTVPYGKRILKIIKRFDNAIR